MLHKTMSVTMIISGFASIDKQQAQNIMLNYYETLYIIFIIKHYINKRCLYDS